jgi:enamine deaminase RidA (YjgF/YER057c/UK114 family)
MDDIYAEAFRAPMSCFSKQGPNKNTSINGDTLKTMANKRKYISSGSEFEQAIGYSRAVVDGDYVFVAGTTGYDYSNMTISSNVVEQAEQCLINIEAVLVQAGSDIDHVVRVRYIFPERDDFKPCWPVFKRYFARAKPAATMLVAGLMTGEMKLEIEVTARLANG